MFPYILENDVVLFKQQNDCKSGDICAVMVNGNDATIKLVKKDKDNNTITLIPFNPVFKEITYTKEEIINKPVRIIGVYAGMNRENLEIRNINM